jgi:hypothetical protein
LVKLATNLPGFTIGVKPDELGTRFMLSKWLETVRKDLEITLLALDLPGKKIEIMR